MTQEEVAAHNCTVSINIYDFGQCNKAQITYSNDVKDHKNCRCLASQQINYVNTINT